MTCLDTAPYMSNNAKLCSKITYSTVKTLLQRETAYLFKKINYTPISFILSMGNSIQTPLLFLFIVLKIGKLPFCSI